MPAFITDFNKYWFHWQNFSHALISSAELMKLLNPDFRNELTCQICTDVITDLDEWLVSAPTEQEIIDFVEEVITSGVYLGGGGVKTDLRNSENILPLPPEH